MCVRMVKSHMPFMIGAIGRTEKYKPTPMDCAEIFCERFCTSHQFSLGERGIVADSNFGDFKLAKVCQKLGLKFLLASSSKGNSRLFQHGTKKLKAIKDVTFYFNCEEEVPIDSIFIFFGELIFCSSKILFTSLTSLRVEVSLPLIFVNLLIS